MKQNFLIGCLAFAALAGFNFRHALNDYGLAMSSFLMAYASDSSSDGTDGTGTDGTTGTGTVGTDETGTDETSVTTYVRQIKEIAFPCKGKQYTYSKLMFPKQEMVKVGYKCIRVDGTVEECSPQNLDQILSNLSAAGTYVSSVETTYDYVVKTILYDCVKDPAGMYSEPFASCRPSCQIPYKCGKINEPEF